MRVTICSVYLIAFLLAGAAFLLTESIDYVMVRTHLGSLSDGVRELSGLPENAGTGLTLFNQPLPDLVSLALWLGTGALFLALGLRNFRRRVLS